MNDRVRRCRDAALALMLAPMLVLAPQALSFAQSPAASDAKAAPAAEPRPPGSPPESAPGSAPDADAAPASLTDLVRATVLARNPAPIALVLPLDSPTYGRAAEAVKAGFAAGAAAARVKFNVIGHGDGDVRAAFDKAKESGARVVVGPLVRDDLRAIAEAGGELPWTIALNQLDEGSALPQRLYTLALALDSEARQLARRARSDGAQTVVVIGGDTPLQKRFMDAFVAEWILAGGGPPVTFRFDRAPDMLRLLRREFIKAAPDAVLLALDAQDVALAKPYLGKVNAYASSQVNERQPREGLRDLDDIRFVEIPWLADPSAAAFAGIARREYPNAAFDRLYALGIDAFRVAQAFTEATPDKLEFDGATGHLTLDPSRQFVREATMLQFRAGEIVPLDAR